MITAERLDSVKRELQRIEVNRFTVFYVLVMMFKEGI
jgi:hypothetical protein